MITNAGLTKFQTRLISWPFILHVFRASVILFFYCVFLVQNIHPNTWKIIPIQNELNGTENIQNNNSFEVSSKFDFRTIVDYAHFFRLLSYVLIISILCDPFSKRITALCKAFQELDKEIIGNQDRKIEGFGKIYSSILLEVICHLIYLTIETIGGISDPAWWRSTVSVRLFLISIGVVSIWISSGQILFEVLITISCLGIKRRIDKLMENPKTPEFQNREQRLLIEIIETFQATFGGIMALHLAFYTIDIFSEIFSTIILGSRGDYMHIIIAIFAVTGRVVRVYNIVSVCDDLSHSILKYVEHLEEVEVELPENNRDWKVLESYISFEKVFSPLYVFFNCYNVLLIVYHMFLLIGQAAVKT